MQSWQSSGEGVSFESPACTLISNGSSPSRSRNRGKPEHMEDLLVTRFEDARFGALQG